VKHGGFTKPKTTHDRAALMTNASDEFALFAFVACVLIGGGAAFIGYVA